MGHRISGLIAKRRPLRDAVPEGWVVAPLAQGFGFAVHGDLLVSPGRPFPAETLDVAERVKGMTAVAAVATDYFGGEGSQAAAAWAGTGAYPYRDGSGSINAALQFLGAEKGRATDPFDALGLSWYRSNDDWIEFARNGKLTWQREPYAEAYAAWTEDKETN